MLFSEKFSKLFALTETKSGLLAKEIHMDPSQISRMKTGARGRPTSLDTVRLIADYFALRCNTDYRLSALSALSGDDRVHQDSSKAILSDVIFTWLCSDTAVDEEAKAKKNGLQIDALSVINTGEPEADKESGSIEKNNPAFLAYYGNNGKRQAVRDLFRLVMNSGEEKELYLFTDENSDWMYEDPTFAAEYTEDIQKLAESGCQFLRIEPPAQGLENSFNSIERWMPAYISGAVQQYYYPHLRDSLHRRTVFLSPGNGALYSYSTSDARQSHITMFTTNDALVDISRREFFDIVRLCKPMMRVYPPMEDELFKSLIRMASMPSDGIYKICGLSIPTLPPEVLTRMRLESNDRRMLKVLENQAERVRLRGRMLRTHRITDMMTLADPIDVMEGRVPISSTTLLSDSLMYYTPEEYCLHLRRIIADMTEFKNYKVVLTDSTVWKDITMYTKNNTFVLIVKSGIPATVFEITERRMAGNLCDYLRRIAEIEIEQVSREQTIDKLWSVIEKIERMIKDGYSTEQ